MRRVTPLMPTGRFLTQSRIALAIPTLTSARFVTDAQTIRAPHRFETFASPESRTYAEDLFELWKKDKSSVDSSWAPIFEKIEGGATEDEALLSVFRRPAGEGKNISDKDRANNMKLAWMIRSYETRGHHEATLDPLGMFDADLDPSEVLNPLLFGFTEADMECVFNVQLGAAFGSIVTEGETPMKLRDIVAKLRQFYCGNVAFEFMSSGYVDKRNWWRNKIIETTKVGEQLPKEVRLRNLENVIKAERFEKFLGKKFATAKRFGVDGAEALVAAMNTCIDSAADNGVEHVVIGMPHRGRLNVLANICGKPFETIFNEFAGKTADEDTDKFHSGDVKYHLGISRDITTPNEKKVNLQLLANPSHLEAVNPLVLGKARAKQHYLGDKDHKRVLPIIMHGDAAFSGQGICYESMGLSGLDNFDVGGTIHVVVNNQVGFTTDPWQSRSAMYCTDLAKVNNAPVMHVNGDDVDAVARVAKIAAEYRQQWGTDVVIDLVCYRRFGHNESDQPKFTQPTMYAAIDKHASLLTKYSKQLVQEGVLTQDEANARTKAFDETLKKDFEKSEKYVPRPEQVGDHDESPADAYVNSLELASLRKTSVPLEALKEIGQKLTTLPEGFTPHPTIATRVVQPRAEAIQNGEGIEWGLAESLAFGALLLEGVHVRITGQDVQRGTFTQRHCTITDYKSGVGYTPLEHLAKSQAAMTASNSSLSEFGVCGFELGYSMENPKALVIWEAQFGDFANGAQIIFDQFMASGESKWVRQSALAVSLPHGYDGMGPEHSSARVERFLQLSDDPETFPADFRAEDWQHLSEKRVKETNWVVCFPSTPANYFHMLRRQVHREFRKPLVFLFSKKYLRAPNVSSLEEMADGSMFKCVLPHKAEIKKTRKIVFCTGQIYHTLAEHQQTNDAFQDVALIRCEQIAPFPYEPIADELEKHLASNPKAEVIWAQEEPKNMGCWSYIRTRMNATLSELGRTGEQSRVKFVGRAAAASPATGFGYQHDREVTAIMKGVFGK